MDSIKNFLKELVTCNIINDLNGLYSYNGFCLEESSVAFQQKVHSLYEDALLEIPFLSQDAKIGFGDTIERYMEIQTLFDAPDESILNSMNREIENGNTNASLRTERDFVKMVCECVSLQKFYLGEFATAIGYTPSKQEHPQQSQIPLENEEDSNAINQEWVYGYEGIQTAFKWGRNKVANFLKNSFYEEAIVRDGRKIAVNVPKTRELMQKKENETKNPKRRR